MKQKHSHDDAPDTAADFRRLSALPEGPPKEHLRQSLATAWLPMSDRLAGRYRNRGESWEDLRQVAAVGLVKAVKGYDPGRGTPFEGYAVPTIEGEIKRHFRDCMWAVHVPRRVQELRSRVREAYLSLDAADGHAPTAAAVAERALLTEEETAVGLAALESFSSLSLDAGQRGGGEDNTMLGSMADTLGDVDTGVDLVVDREAVKPLIRRLSERERMILYMRFFQDRTQSSIASDLGISQMHVSRLISTSCSWIRAQIMAESPARAAQN
ncbi:SigB/SigF/SigG family RNA polymerase sigma factor [Actinacidiphila alni]|nr:SigB/SigF/SigG family RNA polymerase sigma factor [Actinacidiphila alni]